MRVMWYSYEVLVENFYVGGKFLNTADMHFRSPTNNISKVENCFSYQMEEHVFKSLPTYDESLHNIRYELLLDLT